MSDSPIRILVIAPEPFYQERGTPIDVHLLLRVLSKRSSMSVDLLTYHEGEDVELPGVRIYRTTRLPGLSGIRPGFSLKKLICDIQLSVKAWSLSRQEDYDFVHAVEESAFLAMALRRRFGTPFAYDLDSSLARQLVEQRPYLKVLRRFFEWLEGRAIQESLITFPVCNALAELCEARGAPKTVTLHDISQLSNPLSGDPAPLRREVGIGTEEKLVLYVGNLEPYQGIDLLLESFATALAGRNDLVLVVIGGRSDHIRDYREKAQSLGIVGRTHFLGPRPFSALEDYLAAADIVVSPRIRGMNTPMKIFPFLHSGTPLLATDLRTHNQILTDEVALLVPPEPDEFADGMVRLAGNRSLRERLSREGHRFVERRHTFQAYRDTLEEAYDWVSAQLPCRSPTPR